MRTMEHFMDQAGIAATDMTMRGHNLPPSDVDILRDTLKQKHADMAKRTDELLGGIARMPAAIADDETERKAIEFAKQIGDHKAVCEDAHTSTKRPFLEGGRVVDAFFGDMAKPLGAGKIIVLDKLTSYQTAKADAKRKELEEAARKAEEEAMAAAAKVETETDLQQAIVKEEAAVIAIQATQATTADLSRTQGVFGTTSSLRSTLRHRVTDPALVPREYTMVNEDAIKAAMKNSPKDKAGLPTLKIAGVEFYMERKTRV